MVSYQIVFLFLAALVTVSSSDDVTEEEQDNHECGQYGFRCLNEKTLEFCPIAVDGVTDKPQIYECDDDFTCDEDNPAYCTPKEPPNKLVQEASKEATHGNPAIEASDVLDVYDDVYFDEESYYRQARFVRSAKEDDCVCETTSTEEPTTTESVDDIDFTTVEITPAPPFECESYGFFTDKNNVSLFWYCDVPLNGAGFLLRHMMCGHGRYFDEMLKNCVLEGTIRKERKDDNCDLDAPMKELKEPKKAKNTMDCTNKKPGKYADETNRRIYHLCLPKQFSPAIQLTFMCPRGTAYDPTCKSCTIAAFNRLQAKGSNKSDINCRSPTRFRSTEDCSSYFLCFVDNVIEIKCPKFYKFDDMALECLPEKVADCNEYSM